MSNTPKDSQGQPLRAVDHDSTDLCLGAGAWTDKEIENLRSTLHKMSALRPGKELNNHPYVLSCQSIEILRPLQSEKDFEEEDIDLESLSSTNQPYPAPVSFLELKRVSELEHGPVLRMKKHPALLKRDNEPAPHGEPGKGIMPRDIEALLASFDLRTAERRLKEEAELKAVTRRVGRHEPLYIAGVPAPLRILKRDKYAPAVSAAVATGPVLDDGPVLPDCRDEEAIRAAIARSDEFRYYEQCTWLEMMASVQVVEELTDEEVEAQFKEKFGHPITMHSKDFIKMLKKDPNFKRRRMYQVSGWGL